MKRIIKVHKKLHTNQRNDHTPGIIAERAHTKLVGLLMTYRYIGDLVLIVETWA